MSNITPEIIAAIDDRFKKSEPPVRTTRDSVRLTLRLPQVIAAQAQYLNGASPNGNTMMDRGDLAKIVRLHAEKSGSAIPDAVSNAKLARIITQEQKRVGLPLTRDGRIAISIESGD